MVFCEPTITFWIRCNDDVERRTSKLFWHYQRLFEKSTSIGTFTRRKSIVTIVVHLINYIIGVLRQHDENVKKEITMYYLSNTFTLYEPRYTLFERTFCALINVAQMLSHYMSSYATLFLIAIHWSIFGGKLCQLENWQNDKCFRVSSTFSTLLKRF